MGIRRKPKGRVAVVPNQWSGSVQQYYHFLLGYLAPVLLWLDDNGTERITLRDCGPMNPWFEVLDDVTNVELMQVGHFLHVYAGKLQPSIVLRGMDYPDSFDPKRLARFRMRMHELLDVPTTSATATTVLVRTPANPFYFTPESEIDLAGAERRSVPNLAEWGAATALPVDVIDSAAMSAHEQVAVSSATRVLVGQHGAGLTNMVFMPPGGTVIEIHPPLPQEAVNTFRSLAAACGHTYATVAQRDVHAPVDTANLESAIKAAQSSPAG